MQRKWKILVITTVWQTAHHQQHALQYEKQHQSTLYNTLDHNIGTNSAPVTLAKKAPTNIALRFECGISKIKLQV